MKRGMWLGWVLMGITLLRGPAGAAVVATDDTGYTVKLTRPARRVVSLAPSTTEMIFSIGAGGLLVGDSTYDDYPPAAMSLPHVGSFSGPDLERIVAAKPDLIVAAYGNPLAIIARLRGLHIPVYVSNPSTVSGVLRNLADLGRLTGRQASSQRVIEDLQARLQRVAARVRGQPLVSTLVVIADEPLTVAGGKSFIQDIVRRAGGTNAAAGLARAYPTLDPERLIALNPEVVLYPVGNDPAPVQRLEQRPGFRQTRAARAGRFYTLNPDWLMRAGPRVVQGVEAVARLLHPERASNQARRWPNNYQSRRRVVARR